MDELTIGFIMIFLVSVAILFFGSWLLHDNDPLFEYGRNPWRRQCKRCGQQQDQHTWSWGGESWWEDMGAIADKNCKCHEYSTYKSML